MRRYCLVILAALLLSGCSGTEEVFETVADEIVSPVMAQPRQISVQLPEDAAVPALESDTQKIYVSQDYEISIETLSSGDLTATVQKLSGYGADQLTILETQWEDAVRYEFVWVSTGERGDRLGRGVILDDGEYHYCMSLLRDAASAETSQINWGEVFRSFTLV